MDRIGAILRFQWRAYWRRFQRRGNLTTNNAGVWLLFGGIAVFKYLQQLPGVASQLSRSETTRYEALLLAVFLVWMFPVMAETRRSISIHSLLHTPLTSTQLFLIRLASVFVSPASWIITACSLTLIYPIANALHPITGFAALLLFALLSLAISLTIANALSSAYIRKVLLGVVIGIIVAFWGSWLASGKPVTSTSWWPSRLVASAAVKPNPFGSLTLLAAMTTAAFGLAFWSFIRSLESTGTSSSQKLAALAFIDFPGRLGGLVKKDLKYFIRLLDLYLVLPIVIFFIYYLLTTTEPSATMFTVALAIMFLPGISLAGNLFGLDSPVGLDRYAIFPLSARDILVSKNLAFALIFVFLAATIFPFALWGFDVGLIVVAALELLLLGLAYLAWGSWMSVRDPYKMQFYRFSAGGSPTDGIIGMFFGSLPGAIIAVLIYRGDPAIWWKIVLLTIAYLALYCFSVTSSARRLELGKEAIRQSLS